MEANRLPSGRYPRITNQTTLSAANGSDIPEGETWDILPVSCPSGFGWRLRRRTATHVAVASFVVEEWLNHDFVEIN